MRARGFIRAMCWISLLGVTAQGVSGQERPRAEFPLHETRDEEPGAGKPERKPPVKLPAFAMYGKRFSELCALIGADGRKDKLREILEPISSRDDACPACRPLIKTFADGCRSGERKMKSKNPAAPTPTAVSKQREPHLSVSVMTMEIFRDLAGEKKGKEETAEAIRRLLAALESPEGKTKAERDYFTSLADYIRDPCHELLSAPPEPTGEPGEEEEGSEPSGKHIEENVDALFE